MWMQPIVAGFQCHLVATETALVFLELWGFKVTCGVQRKVLPSEDGYAFSLITMEPWHEAVTIKKVVIPFVVCGISVVTQPMVIDHLFLSSRKT